MLVSRRDINKAETRAAIAEAARKIFKRAGFDGLTAEKIAEAAGVSRRTFFNYFPSVDSALNVPVERFIESILSSVEDLDTLVPLADLPVLAVSKVTDLGLFRSVAELFVLAKDYPPLARLQYETWESCSHRLIEFVEERFGRPLTLEGYAFVFSITGAGKSAFVFWEQETSGDFSDASMKKLHSYLVDGLSSLRYGFPTVRNFTREA